MPKGEHVFVDHGYREPSTFSRQFFASPDFSSTTLRKLLGTRKSLKKDSMANDLRVGLEEGSIRADSILQSLAMQPRTWLSFKVGKIESETLPSLNPPANLLQEFGTEGWYGPINDPRTYSPRWYIRVVRVPTYRSSNTGHDISSARWLVFAEIKKKSLALSWDGFTHRPEQDSVENSQFPFWNHFGEFFREIEAKVGGNWKFIDLANLVLEHLWPLYEDTAPHAWHHLRIRAERAGVALNAKSALPGILELERQGLTTLTTQLAQAALRSLDLEGSDKQRVVERALMVTLIKHCGPISYEFQIDKGKEVFSRAHCYFGNRGEQHGQDSIQHIRTYKDIGGSDKALEFFLRHL